MEVKAECLHLWDSHCLLEFIVYFALHFPWCLACLTCAFLLVMVVGEQCCMCVCIVGDVAIIGGVVSGSLCLSAQAYRPRRCQAPGMVSLPCFKVGGHVLKVWNKGKC